MADTSNGLGFNVTDTLGNLWGKSTDYLGTQSLGDIASAGGMLLKGYDSLFGTGADIADQNLSNLKTSGELLKQQLASNKEALEDKRTFNKNVAAASNNLFSGSNSGLGSSLKTTTA